MKDLLTEGSVVELSPHELDRICGGAVPVLIWWMLVDACANADKTYQAFMAGWHSF